MATPENRSKKCGNRVYRKGLPKNAHLLTRKRGVFHVRKHVPSDLRNALDKIEVWRSLGTDSFRQALRRSHVVIGQIEADFEAARSKLGLPVDGTLIQPFAKGPRGSKALGEDDRLESRQVAMSGHFADLTFGEVYKRFMTDPSREWSARTRLSYETTRRLALSIIGAETRMQGFNRAVCRDFMETLRFIPKSTSKRFPELSPREAAQRARDGDWPDLISPANANTYLNKLCVVLNWAVQEEFLVKNHMRGLRLADPVAKREKRMPFNDDQLFRIFRAPLYQGCRDDGNGYAIEGPNRPKGTRFWIPPIGLHSGMRLNETCQLDVSDVRAIDGIWCFVITETSAIGNSDKSLKTRSSERIVPVHPELLRLGFLAFVTERGHREDGKLFGDICAGRDGFRSTAFSKWFVLFLTKAGAHRPLTSYHSFRHTFRDALRHARVDREFALALGGWGNGKSGGDVSDNYR